MPLVVGIITPWSTSKTYAMSITANSLSWSAANPPESTSSKTNYGPGLLIGKSKKPNAKFLPVWTAKPSSKTSPHYPMAKRNMLPSYPGAGGAASMAATMQNINGTHTASRILIIPTVTTMGRAGGVHQGMRRSVWPAMSMAGLESDRRCLGPAGTLAGVGLAREVMWRMIPEVVVVGKMIFWNW